jgi:DNA end-binding protein Ku
MRPLWSGTIALELVALPVKLYPATEEHPVRLREIHTADGGRVRRLHICETENREIPYEEVGRGWETPDGRTVPLTDDDLAHLPLPTSHVIEVLGFVPGRDVDPISYSHPYFVGPDGPGADRPYALLEEALARTGYVAVAKVALWSRERLALLRPRHGVLVLHTLLWTDEIHEPADLAPSTPVTEQELELAEVLMDELTGVEMRELHDDYRRALEQLVEAKAGRSTLVETPEPRPSADLMDALEKSLRAARAERHR